MPSTHPGHILAAGEAKSADPDKFGPKNTDLTVRTDFQK